MSDLNIGYWLFVITMSIIELCIFSTFFDNEKYKNKKGSFIQKIKPTILVIIIFMFPLVYTSLYTWFNFDISLKIWFDTSLLTWFDIVKCTIFLGILSELFMSNNENKLFSYKTLLIVLSFYSIMIIPEKIYETLLLVLLIASKDTLMSIYGKYIVALIPYESIKLRYPKSISKNKTGLSVILSYITMLCLYSYFFDFWLITTVSFGTFFGDAVLSHYKRINNVEDFSNLLGPIGGFADRFDSWIFTFLFVQISGLIIATL
jgi:CDP-diglyceride synthetase